MAETKVLNDEDVLLTTKDNPYNPFTEYDDWKYYDEIQNHYDTEAYVARVVGMLDFDLSPKELAHERVKAFYEIIRFNDELGLDIYTLISREGEKIDPTPSVALQQNDKEGTPGEGPQTTPAP